ncbi:ABC transporter permease subunit [Auraticoccus sp. F435]|uniref:ABC transporter permease subunit n=1 Tax=Auraticoccus cholistanensis TaxID=2656650 RepID=A0A6A9UTJ0_9ACTN|nr:ABC transporter permease subunit [Auraticoccus cholistanensis]MVA76143.1 ABC transporter permease subunit [Auraticoccus cholistanensis]
MTTPTPTTPTPTTPAPTTPAPSLRAALASTSAAASAEWIKLRSLRFTWFALLGAAALTVVFAVVVAASISASAANGYDVTASAAALAAQAVTVGQLPVLMVAVTVVTGEYADASIRLSLRQTPLRGQLLLAKTLVAAAAGFCAGVPLAVAGMVAARVVLGTADTTSWDEAWRTVLGIGGYLALVSALVLGIGAITRSTIVSVLVSLLLLLAAPLLAQMTRAGWLEAATTYLPSTAGTALTSPEGGAYGAGAALAVLAVWVLLAQLGGYVALWLRDA